MQMKASSSSTRSELMMITSASGDIYWPMKCCLLTPHRWTRNDRPSVRVTTKSRRRRSSRSDIESFGSRQKLDTSDGSNGHPSASRFISQSSSIISVVIRVFSIIALWSISSVRSIEQSECVIIRWDIFIMLINHQLWSDQQSEHNQRCSQSPVARREREEEIEMRGEKEEKERKSKENRSDHIVTRVTCMRGASRRETFCKNEGTFH